MSVRGRLFIIYKWQHTGFYASGAPSGLNPKTMLLRPAHICLQTIFSLCEVDKLHMVKGVFFPFGISDHVPEMDSSPVLADQNVVDAYTLLVFDHVPHSCLEAFEIILLAAVVIIVLLIYRI